MKTILSIAAFAALLGGARAAEPAAATAVTAPPPAPDEPRVELSDGDGCINVNVTATPGNGTLIVSSSGKMAVTENGKTRILTMKDGKWVEEAPAPGTAEKTAPGAAQAQAGNVTMAAPRSDEELGKRLARAKLLETRKDGVKVYEEADGTRIYKGDHSLMVVSGGGAAAPVQIGRGAGGATVMGFGNITVTTGPNGEILVSDDMPGGRDIAEMQRRMAEEIRAHMEQVRRNAFPPSAAPRDAARLQTEMMRRQAEQLRLQAEALRKQAEEMQAMAQKLLEANAQAVTPPAPPPPPAGTK